MPEIIRWRSKVILAKVETTYATDPTPTGAANAILMSDVTYAPMEGEDVPRNLERPYLGAQEQFPAGLRGVLTGSTELVGSGTAGTAPAWGVLARAAGLAENIVADESVSYTPVSGGHESVTIHLWVGATRHALKGCRGTGVLRLNAQGIPVIQWTITGLWSVPAEAAPAVPTLTAWQRPRLATHLNTPVFTVGGVSLVLRGIEFDLGVDVQPRLLIGREEIAIVDRAERITANVEAVPLTTFDPFSAARDMSPVALALTHGVTAGHIVSVAAAACQVGRLPQYQEQQGALEWALPLTPLPQDGDDQFEIVCT